MVKWALGYVYSVPLLSRSCTQHSVLVRGSGSHPNLHIVEYEKNEGSRYLVIRLEPKLDNGISREKLAIKLSFSI